ncbi:unnamed protein product [Arabis nemorensis]|uniref:Uncharacterized protein n=1 Tax=Arabis nemorensis TaxID=586526 RepID=A0A565CCB8_9BRAS|nr:unnamed protein product [Arabis nemorensis]
MEIYHKWHIQRTNTRSEIALEMANQIFPRRSRSRSAIYSDDIPRDMMLMMSTRKVSSIAIPRDMRTMMFIRKSCVTLFLRPNGFLWEDDCGGTRHKEVQATPITSD